LESPVKKVNLCGSHTYSRPFIGHRHMMMILLVEREREARKKKQRGRERL
jgi:hypothetical protein